MLDVQIKTIPESEHRYTTLGDYWDDENGVTQIRVSNLVSEKSEFLVALHEFVEQYLLKIYGISEPEVKEFDIMFEKERDAGLHDEYAEPGDDPRAPYREQHFMAETIERMAAIFIGVNWKEHCELQIYEDQKG